MSSVFNDRLDKYGYQTNAEALFLHSAKVKDSKGLRVLLPDKGMEFSDGSYVGTGAFLIDPRTLVDLTLIHSVLLWNR